MVLATVFSASETPSASEPPARPKEAATDTASTLESMSERSRALTVMPPSTSTPAPVVPAMKAWVCEPTRLTVLAPAPPSATPTVPPAMATEPETTRARMSCAVSAVTLRSSVAALPGSAVTEERSTEATMRLAAACTRCRHFPASA